MEHNFSIKQASSFDEAVPQIQNYVSGAFDVGGQQGVLGVGQNLAGGFQNGGAQVDVHIEGGQVVFILDDIAAAAGIEQAVYGIRCGGKAVLVVHSPFPVTVQVAGYIRGHFLELVDGPSAFVHQIVGRFQSKAGNQILVEHQNPGGLLVDGGNIPGQEIGLSADGQICNTALVPVGFCHVDVRQHTVIHQRTGLRGGTAVIRIQKSGVISGVACLYGGVQR